MAKRYRRKVLLVKIEAVAGTAEVLARADAILAVDIERTPVAGDTVSRELERAFYGADEEINVNVHSQIAFGVEIAGSGAAGTAPAWGRLLRACGMAESHEYAAAAADGVWTQAKADADDYDAGDTVEHNGRHWTSTIANNPDEPADGAAGWNAVPAERIEYRPITGGEPTVTIGINIDGILKTYAGSRGTFTAEIANRAVPRFRFTFTGKYASPTDTAAVADPDYSEFVKPAIPSNVNSPTFSLLGINTIGLSSLTLDYGVEVVHDERIGVAPAVEIVDRSASGTLTVDTPPVATLPIEQRAKENATGALQLVHGTVAGNIVQLDLPRIGLSSPSDQENNGVWQTQVNYRAVPVAGNDEVKITVK